MPQVNRVRRRGRSGESGFTLIELLVVIGILGVLAGIVVFNVTGVTDRGSLAACRTDVSTIQAAVDAFRNNPSTGTPAGSASLDGTPGPPPTMAQLTANGAYLHSTPTACLAGSYNIAASGNVTATSKNNTPVP